MTVPGIDPRQFASDMFALEVFLYKLRVVRIVFQGKPKEFFRDFVVPSGMTSCSLRLNWVPWPQ